MDNNKTIETNNLLIKKYTDLGINRDKIFVSIGPAIALWSTTQLRVVGENGIESSEMVPLDNGNYEITYKNNVIVSLNCYDDAKYIPIEEINNSNGIIITNHSTHFRFGFIPNLKNKENYGYHITEFPKGKLGEISKIQEELDELKDAEKQNSKVMMMVELSDLYGAIEEYCKNQNITMEDLKIFSDITKRAFKNGRRS